MTTLKSILVALLVAVPTVLVALPQAAAAPVVTAHYIPSFDGTLLRATLFTPSSASFNNPVPYVLMTHGWAGVHTQNSNDARVKAFLDAGYGVLTWDSRGFGESGGSVMLNSPDFEVKDVKALIDWLSAGFAPVQKVGGDPRIGMAGGSYAGGIQLLSAAFDPRIDAIAPEITWNDLVQSLAPNGVPKTYWTTLLFGAGAEASCVNARNGDPDGALAAAARGRSDGCQTHDLTRYYAQVHGTNGVPDEVRDALLYRSPKTHMASIRAPTLLIQGFPDTLFDVDQAVANYNGLKANNVPVKMWLYDGGHAHPEGPALPNSQGNLIPGVIVNWFDCHLKTVSDCSRVGAAIDYYAADGAWRTSTVWPPAQNARSRTIPGLPPVFTTPGGQGTSVVDLQTGPLTGTVTATGGATVSFTASTSTPDAILFASLGVRSATGTVARVGEQAIPVRINGFEGPVPVSIDLVDVTAKLGPGETLVLTLAGFDRDFGGSRAAGFVNIQGFAAQWKSI